MKHSELMKILNNNEIELVELSMSKNIKGLYADNVIAINKNITTKAEKACVLAEEIGHYHTSMGNILDQSKTSNRKQEYKARRWAIRKFIRIDDFIRAFEAGVSNKYELAEFLEVTELFIVTALDHYKNLYGMYKQIGNYVIYFDPLVILKKFI